MLGEDSVTRFPIAAITDEFALDLDTALDAMAKIGMHHEGDDRRGIVIEESTA